MSRRKQQRKQRHKRLEKQGLGQGNSKYAQKVKAGNQMYGDGKSCCGHRFAKQRLGSRQP